MAFDPSQTLHTYSRTDCTVQFWMTDGPSGQFKGIKDAVTFARDNKGKWNDVDITVHLAREDITYGSDKVRMLIDALERQSKKPADPDSDLQ
jgi:hypothetical protein